MEVIQQSIEEILSEALEKRKEDSLLRTLQWNPGMVDFCSNDYLSFARSKKIRRRVETIAARLPRLSGATGSRSISGNTAYAEELEKFLARFHHTKAGLLFNSGYDANVGLLSCIAAKEDLIFCDELVHASIIDGCRLNRAKRLRFQHNDVKDLRKMLFNVRSNHQHLKHANGQYYLAKNIFIVVESVYSMDGDVAPLPELVSLCKEFDANLIVDEAHATGVFGEQGRGLVQQHGLEHDVFARVHTFGKAIGCHGAVVVGSEVLRDYLINFARPFIFTTALPFHSLITIRSAYEELKSDEFDYAPLYELIMHFRTTITNVMKEVRGKATSNERSPNLMESTTPIQCLMIPGNERAKKVATELQKRSFDVRAILSPSVPASKERLRISIHLHNSKEEIDQLGRALCEILISKSIS